MRSNKILPKENITKNDEDKKKKETTKNTLVEQYNLRELTKDAGGALTTFLFTCVFFFLPFINILLAVATKFNARAGIKVNELDNRGDTFSRIMNSLGTVIIVVTILYTFGLVIVLIFNSNLAIKFLKILNLL